MPTQPYLIDGVRVPSVTTIIGHRKAEIDGLLWWAYDKGTKGIDWRDARQKEANAGTLGHDLIQRFIHGEDDPSLRVLSGGNDEDDACVPVQLFDGKIISCDEEAITKGQQGYTSFRRWLNDSKIALSRSEMSICHKELRFGGTIDGDGLDGDDQYVLCDWKVSNAIYPDYLIQLSAYVKLYEYAHPDRRIERVHLCRFGKTMADFHHHSWPREAVDTGWHQFELLTHVYYNDKKLKKMVGR